MTDDDRCHNITALLDETWAPVWRPTTWRQRVRRILPNLIGSGLVTPAMTLDDDGHPIPAAIIMATAITLISIGANQ